MVPPSEAVAPGSGIAVSLLAVNSGDTSTTFNPPVRLDGTLRQGSLTWAVQLRAVRQGGVWIAPHGFAKFDYVFTLPATAQGPLILEAGPGLARPVVAMITAAAAGGASPAEPGRAETSVPYSVASLSTQPATSLMARSFIDHISPNDPVYFVYGPKAPAAKFQFSLKYRLFTFDSEANAQYDSTVQFGYTQRSLWDVTAHPESLYDTSYMPSVFYQFLSPSPNPTGGTEITWLGFAAGYQHESNGQGGTLERSLNTLYARTGVLIGRTDQWHAVVVARGFGYVGGLADNPALKNYRGYGDWTFRSLSSPSISMVMVKLCGRIRRIRTSCGAACRSSADRADEPSDYRLVALSDLYHHHGGVRGLFAHCGGKLGEETVQAGIESGRLGAEPGCARNRAFDHGRKHGGQLALEHTL